MGVAATVGLAVASGLWEGYSAKQQANAQAAQANANAQMAFQNSQKVQEQAEQTAQNNAINEENQRRKMARQQAAAANMVGASGVTNSGSAAAVLADNEYAMAFDLATERYNGRQKVDSLYQNATDYFNQGNVYKDQAKEYKKAGKRAMLAAAIKTGATVATGLYSAHAAKAGSATSGSVGSALNFQPGLSVQQQAINNEFSRATTGTIFGSSYSSSIGKNLKYTKYWG